MKSEKFEKAVARAENKNAELAPIADPTGMISRFDPAEFAKEVIDNDLECAPQLIALEEGQVIRGYVLEGNGPIAEFIDRDTGVVREVQTWILATPDGRMRGSLLSSAQLDRKLPPFVGQVVTIARGPDKNTSNGHRVTEYLVAGPKLANGAKRNWSDTPKLLSSLSSGSSGATVS